MRIEDSATAELANSLRRVLIMFLNKSLPYLYLELKSPTTFRIYFPSDAFGAIEENLIGNIYFDRHSIRGADTIIDLGAHAGSFTIYAILHSKPRTRIIAVEPDEKNYRLLLANIKFFKDIIKEKRLEVLALRKAVWSHRGKHKFTRTADWSEGGHISEIRYAQEGAYVETITLDDVLIFSRGRTIVKMDIEGAEVPVLLSSKHLCRASELAIETHGREALLAKILRVHGYEYRITVYKLNPQLFREWLKVKPKIYGFTVAMYRFLASSIFCPTITMIKAVKRS